jgi:hypothetical protein
MNASSPSGNSDSHYATAWTFQGIFNGIAVALCAIAGVHAFSAGERTFAPPFAFAFAAYFFADALLSFRLAAASVPGR